MSFKPFLFSGEVIHGHGRGGSQLGFPTANAKLDKETTEQLRPYKDRVFYGWGSVVAVPGKKDGGEGPYQFAMSIGFNPHFHDKELTAEVYFLHEFEGDFYGAVIKIIVLGIIREMKAFASLEELMNAIKGDVQHTREALQKPELQRYKENKFLTPSLAPSEKYPYFEQLSE